MNVDDKLKLLNEAWPEGVVLTSRAMKAKGFSDQLVQKYCQSGQLVRIGHGAFVRRGEAASWAGAFYTMQYDLGRTVHLGGRAVLNGEEIWGTEDTPIVLYNTSRRKQNLPAWFQRTFNGEGAFRYTQCYLFESEVGLTSKCVEGFDLIVSEPERAILECLYRVPTTLSVAEAIEIVRGLNDLRPELMQKLLESCRHILVKRLFLCLADICGLPVLKKLQNNKMDLGSGVRVVSPGGKYFSKYELVLACPPGYGDEVSSMSAEELDFLLKEGEGLTVEFKESFSNKVDRDIVAFANTEGGRLLIGVNDSGKIVGKDLTNDLKAKINNLARNCEPPVSIKAIESLNRVIIVSIGESAQKPHACTAGYFRRLDAATQKMNQRELRLLFEADKTTPSFEALVHDEADFEDIDTSKIVNFLSDAGIEITDPKPEAILQSLRLAEGGKIKNAGVLLFARHPRNFIFHCEMTLVAFKGTKGVHIYDRVDVQDDLLTQFHKAMAFLRMHLNVRSEIEGERRRDIYEIPLSALREAVVNAIIHRDYGMTGTSILIEVHEDRVVIKNPGSLPKGVDLETLKQVSIRRNELLADVFARLERAERIGSGIKRMLERVADAGLPAPIIEHHAFFCISFARAHRFGIPEHAVSHVSASSSLTERQETICRSLENRKLMISELMVLLPKPIAERTLRRELQHLRDEGLVDYEGEAGWQRKWFLCGTF